MEKQTNNTNYVCPEMGDPGRRGRLGGVPFLVSKLAEEYASHLTPPYDMDDIISAFESGYLKCCASKETKDAKVKRLMFAIDEYGRCITNCPHKMGGETKVGSAVCVLTCVYCAGSNQIEKTVDCRYPE